MKSWLLIFISLSVQHHALLYYIAEKSSKYFNISYEKTTGTMISSFVIKKKEGVWTSNELQPRAKLSQLNYYLSLFLPAAFTLFIEQELSWSELIF